MYTCMMPYIQTPPYLHQVSLIRVCASQQLGALQGAQTEGFNDKNTQVGALQGAQTEGYDQLFVLVCKPCVHSSTRARACLSTTIKQSTIRMMQSSQRPPIIGGC